MYPGMWNAVTQMEALRVLRQENDRLRLVPTRSDRARWVGLIRGKMVGPGAKAWRRFVAWGMLVTAVYVAATCRIETHPINREQVIRNFWIVGSYWVAMCAGHSACVVIVVRNRRRVSWSIFALCILAALIVGACLLWIGIAIFAMFGLSLMF